MLTDCGGFTFSPKKNWVSKPDSPALAWRIVSRAMATGNSVVAGSATLWPSGSVKRASPLPSSPISASPLTRLVWRPPVVVRCSKRSFLPSRLSVICDCCSLATAARAPAVSSRSRWFTT